jgi:hypothetical protein
VSPFGVCARVARQFLCNELAEVVSDFQGRVTFLIRCPRGSNDFFQINPRPFKGQPEPIFAKCLAGGNNERTEVDRVRLPIEKTIERVQDVFEELSFDLGQNVNPPVESAKHTVANCKACRNIIHGQVAEQRRRETANLQNASSTWVQVPS